MGAQENFCQRKGKFENITNGILGVPYFQTHPGDGKTEKKNSAFIVLFPCVGVVPCVGVAKVKYLWSESSCIYS